MKTVPDLKQALGQTLKSFTPPGVPCKRKRLRHARMHARTYARMHALTHTQRHTRRDARAHAEQALPPFAPATLLHEIP